MNYSKVIRESWQLVVNLPKLKWFAFVPSFVAVLIFILEILWQIYMYSSEFGFIESDFSFEAVGSVFSFLLEKNLMFWTILGVFFIVFFAFVVPSWLRGVLILSVRHNFDNPDRYCSLRRKSVDACSYFFRLFELNAILAPFEFVSIAFFVATFYRYFHENLFQFLLPLIVLHLIIAFFIQVFFAFVSYFVVIEDLGLSQGLKKSIGLVFMNLGATLSVILLMFFVNFRVIVNVIVILGVPIAILAVFSYFAFSFAVTLSVVLAITMVSFAAYLTSILEVFSTAVWERTFAALLIKQAELAGDEVNNN